MNLSGRAPSGSPRLFPAHAHVGHRLIRRGDAEWPSELERMDSQYLPTQLHASGQRFDPGKPAVAIVGPRRASATGMEIAEWFAKALAEAGFVIVSGLANGIDAMAHRSALAADGNTVAFVGCGLDIDYPTRNSGLRRSIDAKGTVFSEYPAGTPPRAHHFPARNRLIAGMSLGVVVIEGTLRSGALITARFADAMGRSVFAVPGAIRNPLATGPNALIKGSTATLVTDPHEVCQDLAPRLVWEDQVDRKNPTAPALADDEIEVLRAVAELPASKDRIARATGLNGGRLSLALARVEVRGLAERSMSGYRITAGGARCLAAAISSENKEGARGA